MSTRKNLRTRSQVTYKESEGTPRKKIKTEKVEPAIKVTKERVQSKQPIIAPNGKIFYPCQYCSKIFPQKSTSLTHMKKCPNKNSIFSDNKNADKNDSIINNNDVEQSKLEENRGIEHSKSEANKELNGSVNRTENVTPEPKIKLISQIITVTAAQSEKQIANDPSIYDYDEQDDQNSVGNDSKENDDATNDRLCKHCKLLFDNPLDLLRHTRDCHSFPRTILPPHEIEKYFDSPNREFCPICEKPIKTRNFRSVFIKHLLVHTTGLTHECSVCKKKFRRRDHMRNHEKRHIVSV